MALPANIDPTSPLGSDSPSLGDDQFRALKTDITDVLGMATSTNIAAAAFEIVAAGLKTVIMQDAATDPVAAGQIRRNADLLRYHNGTSVITLHGGTTSVADGGTGRVTLTAGAYLKGDGTNPVALQVPPIPVTDGGTGQTSFTGGNIIYGAGSGALDSDNALFFDEAAEPKLNVFAAAGQAGILQLNSTRGTLTAPTPTQSGDVLGGVRFMGFGTAYANSAGMYAVATEAFGAADSGSELRLYSTANALSSPVTGLTLGQDGVVTFGRYAGGGGGFALISNATGAISVVANPLPVANGGTGTASSIAATRVVFTDGSGNYTGSAGLTFTTAASLLTVSGSVGTGAVNLTDAGPSSTAGVLSRSGRRLAYGDGATAVSLSGILSASIPASPTGNVGATYQALAGYTVPANTLSANARGLRLRMSGSFAANANAKRIDIIWGGSLIQLNPTTANPDGGVWMAEVHIWRRAAGSQYYEVESTLNTGGTARIEVMQVTGAGEDETTNLSLILAAQAVDDNDILYQTFIVEILN